MRKCLNPNVTTLQKVIYCSKPCCLVMTITSLAVIENTPIGSKLHSAAAYCCATSSLAYAGLRAFDKEKLVIKPKPEL